jgi:hypothetical protein
MIRKEIKPIDFPPQVLASYSEILDYYCYMNKCKVVHLSSSAKIAPSSISAMRNGHHPSPRLADFMVEQMGVPREALDKLASIEKLALSHREIKLHPIEWPAEKLTDFTTIIRHYCHVMEITQWELAYMHDFSKSYISQLNSGVIEIPNMRFLKIMRDVMGVDANVIFDLIEFTPSDPDNKEPT